MLGMVLMAIELHSSRAFRDSYRWTSQLKWNHSPVPCYTCALCHVPRSPMRLARALSRYKLILPHRVTVAQICYWLHT